MKNFIFLFIAIILETIATSCLKASDSFTKFIPSVCTVIGYAGAFYFLSLTIRTVPLGIAYAVWSGIGIVLITAVGYFAFKQKLDIPALIGIALIVSGVLVIQLFSKTTSH